MKNLRNIMVKSEKAALSHLEEDRKETFET